VKTRSATHGNNPPPGNVAARTLSLRRSDEAKTDTATKNTRQPGNRAGTS
jgi:hypothetical protein